MNNELIMEWDELWRYPALVKSIAQDGDVEPAKAARALLNGIAASHSPKRALIELITAGEFGSVESLLGKLSSARVIPASEIEEINKILREARRRALDEIEVRQFELKSRALRAGLDAHPP